MQESTVGKMAYLLGRLFLGARERKQPHMYVAMNHQVMRNLQGNSLEKMPESAQPEPLMVVFLVSLLIELLRMEDPSSREGRRA